MGQCARFASLARGIVVVTAVAFAACGDDDTVGQDAGGGTDFGTDLGAGEDLGRVVEVDCTGAPGDDFYLPPPDLPDHTIEARGELVRCATLPTLEASALDMRARRPIGFDAGDPDNYEGPALASSASATLLGYRSERFDGSGTYASGTLYLPTEATEPAPLLVYVAGTTGLGDQCAPSKGLFQDLERALPLLLGEGTAVLVPDLIGLGTPGTYGYLEPHEAAHAVLDGARAAMQAAPEGALDGQVLVAGHSAGGHAAMATQALQAGYAPGVNVVGVAGVAPAWFDFGIFGRVVLTASRTIDPAVNGNTGSFVAMYYAGIGAAYDGEAAAWNPIAADVRADVMAAFESGCIETHGGFPHMTQLLFEAAPTIGDLFDSSFATSLQSCSFGACTGAGAIWNERFAEGRPPLDPDGAPVFFLVGDADATIPIDSIAGVMDDAGFGTGCCFRGATHNTTATKAAPWLVDWVRAVAAGAEAPACPDTSIAECVGGGDMDAGPGDMDAGVGGDAGATLDAGVADGGV